MSVIVLGFISWKKKEENEKGLNVITPHPTPPHPLPVGSEPPYKRRESAQQTPEAGALGQCNPSPFVPSPEDTYVSQTATVCPEGLSWASLQRQGQVTLRGQKAIEPK